MRFYKLHGLGNDFIVFDGIADELPPSLGDAGRISALCDRHRGIGADGVLLLLPATSPSTQARMRVLNADGSEPEMCGNGIRCAARLLWDLHRELIPGDRLVIDTGHGPLHCALRLDQRGAVGSIRVEMGRATIEQRELSIALEGDLKADGMVIEIGNPHFVVFCDPDRSPREWAERWGPILERHPRFRRRTNVEFARLGDQAIEPGDQAIEPGDQAIELWVWERGCGITQACGTGACATAVAAVARGLRAAGNPVAVDLPGGRLMIEVAADLSRVWMEGPAEAVFVGELPLEVD